MLTSGGRLPRSGLVQQYVSEAGVPRNIILGFPRSLKGSNLWDCNSLIYRVLLDRIGRFENFVACGLSNGL